MDEKELELCKVELAKVIYLAKELKIEIHLAASILLLSRKIK